MPPLHHLTDTRTSMTLICLLFSVDTKIAYCEHELEASSTHNST